MSKSTSETSAIAFADLESFVRERAQSFIQGVLEEEVEELLGRRKSERRETGDPVGYRFVVRHMRLSDASMAEQGPDMARWGNELDAIRGEQSVAVGGSEWAVQRVPSMPTLPS